jgi:arsenate reductase (thioredoxin)
MYKREKEKKKILFLCTHNSSRSQIAEGLMRYLYGDIFDVYSAGTEPKIMHPYALKVMTEIGIDISGHSSKSLQLFLDHNFDYVITVCDNAYKNCPVFPGSGETAHQSFQDPSILEGLDKDKLDKFREVRDEIKAWIIDKFKDIQKGEQYDRREDQ